MRFQDANGPLGALGVLPRTVAFYSLAAAVSIGGLVAVVGSALPSG